MEHRGTPWNKISKNPKIWWFLWKKCPKKNRQWTFRPPRVLGSTAIDVESFCAKNWVWVFQKSFSKKKSPKNRKFWFFLTINFRILATPFNFCLPPPKRGKQSKFKKKTKRWLTHEMDSEKGSTKSGKSLKKIFFWKSAIVIFFCYSQAPWTTPECRTTFSAV